MSMKSAQTIEKSIDNIQKAEMLEGKIRRLLDKSKSTAAKNILLVALKDLRCNKQQNQILLEELREATMDQHFLHEKKFHAWRALSPQEKKVNFIFLNEVFNEYEKDFKDELIKATKTGIIAGLNAIKNKIDSDDVKSIGKSLFISYSVIAPILIHWIKKSFEQGKIGAALEMKKSVPATPLKNIQLMNLNADALADAFVSELNTAAKQKAHEGLVKDLSTATVLAIIQQTLQDKASRMINNISGNIVGENINNGRRTIFKQFSIEIIGYRRSELLDGRTCNFCLSIDNNVVAPNDPMQNLDQVHYNCRGLWTPIMIGEELPPKIGLNPKAANSLETVAGIPTVNAFKQLKTPANDLSGEAESEIKKRLQE